MAIASVVAAFVPIASVAAEGAAPAPVVTEAAVPTYASNFFFGTLGVIGGRVVVGDLPGGSTCWLDVVAPTSLRVASSARTSCENPYLAGEQVMPVESVTPVGSEIDAVRIAVRDQSTGAVHLGPVVMRYGNFSDTRPEWTYGGGYLWLYDVGTENVSISTKLPAEVLRISLLTGHVLSTVLVRARTRVTLAADDDGLWMASSSETTGRDPILSFLGESATHPVDLGLSGANVNWIVAVGHTAWIGLLTSSPKAVEEMATYSSPTAPPRIAVDRRGTPAPTELGQGSFDQQPVLDAPGIGLVALAPGWLDSIDAPASLEQVLKIDPTTGASSVLATFHLSPAGSVVGNLIYNGALFALVGDGAYAKVYRIKL